MAKQNKSRMSDYKPVLSRIRDKTVLGDALKTARASRELSQSELAAKLGLRQRQISDLERAAVDPRLSTIQNVARALDLELMLIPRHLIAAVEALQRAGSDADKRPLYSLGDEDTEGVADEPPHPEVGDSAEPTRQPGDRSHSRRRPEQ